MKNSFFAVLGFVVSLLFAGCISSTTTNPHENTIGEKITRVSANDTLFLDCNSGKIIYDGAGEKVIFLPRASLCLTNDIKPITLISENAGRIRVKSMLSTITWTHSNLIDEFVLPLRINENVFGGVSFEPNHQDIWEVVSTVISL